MKSRFNFIKSELFKILVFSEMKPKRAGAIDFTLLGIFFFILFSLSLLVVSTNHGLMNSLVDTFLSKNKDATIPLYVGTNLGIDKPISSDILKELKNETGIDSEVFVKADESTGFLYGFEKTKKKEWKGKFLFEDSKIWKEYVSSTKINNTIVLNKNSFNNHFNYKIYKKNIIQELNKKDLDFPKEFLDLESIWLRFDNKSLLVKFKIVWVDNIYNATDTDFLLPMKIYAKQYYQTRSKTIQEGNSKLNLLLDSLKISMYNYETMIEEIKVEDDAILKRISKHFKSSVNEKFLTFVEPIDKVKLDRFLNNNIASYKIMEGGESFDKFEIIDGVINVTVNKERIGGLDILEINKDSDGIKLVKDKKSTDYIIQTKYKDILFSTNLIAYAKGKNDIDKTRKLVESFKYKDDKRTFFRIDPLYNNALQKLGFLTTVLTGLVAPYSIVLAFIFLTLIISQILLIISHRKSQYSIAIAKGLERDSIFIVLATQLGILAFVSSITSFIFMKIMSYLVVFSTIESTEIYKDVIDVTKLNILPIYFSDLVIILLIILLISLISAFMYMKKINITNRNGYIGKNMKG